VAVVLTNNDFHLYAKEGEVCSLCSKKLRPPFLAWTGNAKESKGVFLCAPCTRSSKRGLFADFIHLAAIHDLAAIYPGYTLTRWTLQQLRQAEADHEEPAAVIATLTRRF
jgi:hypothetical protein